jgi:hypothetical protein
MYMKRQLWNFRPQATNLGVQSQGDPSFTRLGAERKVQSQYFLSYPAYSGEWNDSAALELKVLRPLVGAWIKQQHQFTRDRIERRDVWAFEAIAVEAGQGKVGRDCLATMSSCNEVIRFVRKEGLCFSQ